MTQPSVYFTLDAPFVSIIGLYSNVLEGPGVISSQGGHFPLVDDQLNFLTGELKRLKSDRNAGKRAVVLVLHHPPLSADPKNGGSTGAQADIDACCKAAGLYPDVVLSGHAHLYQRFTRKGPGSRQTPYIVAGNGGFAATLPPGKLGPAPITIDDHTLEINPMVVFGYLMVTTDAKTITVSFRSRDVSGVRERDSVTVDLKTSKIVASASGVGVGAGGGSGAGGGPPVGKKPVKRRPKK